MINNENEIKEFLKKHPRPAIKQATTMKDGFVKCISPIPTICGAEVMCSPDTRHELARLIGR